MKSGLIKAESQTTLTSLKQHDFDVSLSLIVTFSADEGLSAALGLMRAGRYKALIVSDAFAFT
jgi:hypothetical protein